MDALELLRSDHDAVRQLFKRFEQAEENGDTGSMAELSATIIGELEIHTRIEEQHFYPKVKEQGDELEDLVNEGVEEHHVVDMLIGEIRGLKAGDDAFAAKMKVLIENVEHHAEEEETEMFPKVREALGTGELGMLGDTLRSAKERAQQGADIDLTRDELYKKAQEQDVPGRSSMTKDELAKALGES